MIVRAIQAPYAEDKHLALLKQLDPIIGLKCLTDNIRNGNITLYEVMVDGFLVGLFMARVETLINGEKELVIFYAVAVSKPTVAMTSILNPLFDKIATDKSIKTIRVHSEKKGLDKILEANGYEFLETVYRKVI